MVKLDLDKCIEIAKARDNNEILNQLEGVLRILVLSQDFIEVSPLAAIHAINIIGFLDSKIDFSYEELLVAWLYITYETFVIEALGIERDHLALISLPFYLAVYNSRPTKNVKESSIGKSNELASWMFDYMKNPSKPSNDELAEITKEILLGVQEIIVKMKEKHEEIKTGIKNPEELKSTILKIIAPNVENTIELLKKYKLKDPEAFILITMLPIKLHAFVNEVLQGKAEVEQIKQVIH